MHKNLNVAGIVVLFFTGELKELAHGLFLSHCDAEMVFARFNDSQVPLEQGMNAALQVIG